VATASEFARRTPLARALQAIGAPRWRALGDTAIVDDVEAGPDAPAIGIADLSPLPRLGFKGRGTLAAMQARGITLENSPNRAFRQADGGLCLVLGPGEVFLLGNLEGDGTRLAALEGDWNLDDNERTYPLLRRDSHAWLAIRGSGAPQIMAKLCGVDLRSERFPDLAIAQTSVARLNAIVVRSDVGGTLAFHVLADSASALYLWTCLQDAGAEFGAGVIGLRALRGRTGDGQTDS